MRSKREGNGDAHYGLGYRVTLVDEFGEDGVDDEREIERFLSDDRVSE
jgi:hypothetical protein